MIHFICVRAAKTVVCVVDAQIRALLTRKFHTSLISHHVTNWYQYVTFGKCEIYVRLISIFMGGIICAQFHILYL